MEANTHDCIILKTKRNIIHDNVKRQQENIK